MAGIGLWVANGHPGDAARMLSWRPAAVTCFYDYLGDNRIFEYKRDNPDITVIIRFQHDQKWWQDIYFNAVKAADIIVSKWSDIQRLDPYVYFGNEMNLHYENGDPNAGNQWFYTTPEFYQNYGDWVRMVAGNIKDRVPEMKLVTPPFAFGHREDGEPDADGNPKIGWAGYDYLADTVREYFDNILTFHGYWHQTDLRELYDPEHSSWYAYRWRRILKLFETRYGMDCTMLIDECGNFDAGASDFTNQLLNYATECEKDTRVIALTPFLWSDPTNSPGNVPNSWVQRMSDSQLQAHINTLKLYNEMVTPEPEPEPEPINKSLFAARATLKRINDIVR